MINLTSFTTVYQADLSYLRELEQELQSGYQIIENLVFSTKQKSDICFALDVWLKPQLIEFTSVSDAAKQLRHLNKYWFLNPISHVRRSRLIQEQLPKLPPLNTVFPRQQGLPQIGCFSLLDHNRLVCSPTRWKNPPLGDFQFVEDKVRPPNRAYLKLWEALSLLDRFPKLGDRVIDLGASPGGWTYVMQTCGAYVIALDKSPLASSVACLPRVTFLKESAFAFDPARIAQSVEWVLSDVVCYPARLYELAQKWIHSNKAKQLIFTIKLQGATDMEAIQQFQSIPGGRVIHLHHNKHEATFFYPVTPSLIPHFDTWRCSTNY